MVDHVVEVVLLRRHGAEPLERRPERQVGAGAPKALPTWAALTSASGADTGESHTIAPASRSACRAAVAMVTNPPML